VIRYRVGDAEATRRARWASVVRAVSSLAPIALAIILLHRLGWAPTLAFWAVAGVLVALVVTRAGLGYSSTRRKLRSLVVTVSDEDLHVENVRDGYSIARARVARIFEAHVPRGGEGFADVRGMLESWTTIERRGRRGPATRVAMGAAVVGAIFFVPFLLEDFVARSKLVAAGLVAGMWLVMRVVLRGR